jgi:RNA-binding protein
MRAVGRVLHAYGKRMLIVRCDAAQLPRLYSEILDRRMRPVGKIVDIFGNVQVPCATVVCRDRCDIAAGEKLFTR